MTPAPLSPWLDRWGLSPDGDAFQTTYTKSWLMPVRRGAAAAMLKVATSEEEIRGAQLMDWWAGDGAARVLAREDAALLLERLPATRSLADMARTGDDEGATRILCAVADRLHAPRLQGIPPGLVPLEVWLRALAPAAATHGGVLAKARKAAEALLAEPRDIAVLHGDLHHENVLDAGARGWLAIDPKGVLGERGYDYVTLLFNPDEAVAVRPGRLARQVAVVAEAARLEPARLTQWALIHAGVSYAWCLADNMFVDASRRMAEMATALADPG